MAGEITTTVPAWGGDNTLRRGVKRLLARTRLQQLNCLEVTGISRKYFLGIPYRANIARRLSRSMLPKASAPRLHQQNHLRLEIPV